MIVCADCRLWLPSLAPDSAAACVTDPPYGIGFMANAWDKDVPGVEVWQEALRVLSPGGFLLAFGGTRFFHRIAGPIEAAGFEVKDAIAWLYGSGLPKSKDIAKEYEARLCERIEGKLVYIDTGEPMRTQPPFRDPDANEWAGFGTALKPAMELICLARKPLSEKTVAANVLRWGTGAINVDGCRIGVSEDDKAAAKTSTRGPVAGKGYVGAFGFKHSYESVEYHSSGRWPANLVLDEEAGRQMDDVVGGRPSAARAAGVRSGIGFHGARGDGGPALDASDGGPSRFFYCAKASRREREAGCEEFAEKALQWSSGPKNPGSCQAEGTHKAARNHHPTVKPLALMRWLCRLVTPPGGRIIDPFAGSGSTLIAAGLEGFEHDGCELERGYAEIAAARLAHWLGEELPDFGEAPDLRPHPAPQTSLRFG